MRGRKPDPKHVQDRKGNPGKRAVRDEIPPPPASLNVVEPIEFLDAMAKREFFRVLSTMPEGVITARDSVTLSAYCHAVHRWRAHCRAIQKEGYVLKLPNGARMKNPHVEMERKARAEAVKYGGLLGLNPSERARLDVPPPPTEEDLEDEDLMD